MLIKFQVITKVDDGDGNLASALGDLWHEKSDGTVEKVNPMDVLNHNYMIRVFHVGEVIIVNESGREIPYPGRKASKWYVEYEEFDDLETALDRAEKAFNDTFEVYK